MKNVLCRELELLSLDVFCELGDNMWSHRHSSGQRSYSAVPYAHKEFSHSETSGKIEGILNLKEMSCFSIDLVVKQLLRNKLVSTARDSIRKNKNLSQLYRSMQEAYTEMQTPLVYQTPADLVCSIHFDDVGVQV